MASIKYIKYVNYKKKMIIRLRETNFRIKLFFYEELDINKKIYMYIFLNSDKS